MTNLHTKYEVPRAKRYLVKCDRQKEEKKEGRTDRAKTICYMYGGDIIIKSVD